MGDTQTCEVDVERGQGRRRDIRHRRSSCITRASAKRPIPAENTGSMEELLN